MTTESAFATSEDSEHSTGYETNTETVDGKKKRVISILLQSSTAFY